ncbi:hypothetical protein HPP92_024228 [Vanilla planifolia]|uniref:Uncharacterized protein n=1 Tax=Vanilla planifolia TaxID=51239 RepID=A0A835PPG9_VANPL|nr:hypothetical protein HPP92_024544 [Vanilla planifolia]KAG0456440.1 hypothetical protein HPP92_024228 [Vanilla planifolia]
MVGPKLAKDSPLSRRAYDASVVSCRSCLGPPRGQAAGMRQLLEVMEAWEGVEGGGWEAAIDTQTYVAEEAEAYRGCRFKDMKKNGGEVSSSPNEDSVNHSLI